MKGIKTLNRGNNGTYLEFTDKQSSYLFGAKDGTFVSTAVIVTPEGALVSEAPIDGVTYARKDATWVSIPSVESFKGRVYTENVITVHPTDASAAYNSIKEAVESITDSSSINRYTVNIGPGQYSEDNNLTTIDVPSFVTIKTEGLRSVVVTPTDPSKPLFSVSGTNTFVYFEGIVFSGNTGSSAPVVECTSTGIVNVLDCVLRDCSDGLLQNNANGTLEVRRLVINSTGALVTNYGIKCTTGRLGATDILVRQEAKVDKAIDITETATGAKITDFTSTSPDVQTALELHGGITALSTINIRFAYDGMVIYGNNTEVVAGEVKILESQNDGFRIDNVGTGIILSLFSGVVLDAGNLNFNILNPNCIVTGNGYTRINSSYIDPNAIFIASLLDITEGDEGLNIIGELHVGTPLRPAESIFGKGDSHIFEYVYTETPGNVFTDRTSEATSFSGSTFSFDGVAADNSVYIGNRFPMTFEGIKILIDSAADMGTGSIVAEYWNGATWEEFNGCTSLSTPGFLKYAKNYFAQAGSFHIKYNPYIRDTWVVNDPMSLGESLYWMRFRIASAITTSPIIQQIKVHTDRAEINTDGTVERHMDARVYKKLPIAAIKPIEGSMQSASIYVDENVGIGLENNRFTSIGDLLGVSFELPEDCDTSAPLTFVWKGKFATTGNVDFTVRRKIVAPGDSYTNSEPAASGDTLTLTTGTVAIAAADTREDFRIDIDISDAVPSRENGFGDEIWITLQYSTRGAGNFDYTKLSANYLSDFDGRHIRH